MMYSVEKWTLREEPASVEAVPFMGWMAEEESHWTKRAADICTCSKIEEDNPNGPNSRRLIIFNQLII